MVKKLCCLSAILFAFAAVPSFAAPRAQTKTFSREADPVIIKGEKLSLLIGKPIANIRVFVLTGGSMVPIPFQIDERDADGSLVFPFGPKPTKDADSGLLDNNDELVFMAKDLGQRRASPKNFPRGNSKAVEIKVTDPLNGATAWACAFYFADPPKPSPVDYVSISADGKRVEARNFFMTFSKNAPIGFDSLGITTAGGGNGKSSVDKLKIRVNTVLRLIKTPVNRSEDDFESETVAFIDGPVRVVRRTINKMMIIWKIASPGSTIDNVFYYNAFEFPTEVQVPFDIGILASEFRFRISTDGNENQMGKIFLNEKNPEVVKLDGRMSDKEKALDLSPYKWSVVYGTEKGNTGAWINRLEFLDNIEAVPRLYYMDDINALEPPENVPGQFGAMGYDVAKMETVKKGSWRITSFMYNKPTYKPGDEKEFLNILDHPLSVSTSAVNR